jgi:antitoxin VapB
MSLFVGALIRHSVCQRANEFTPTSALIIVENREVTTTISYAFFTNSKQKYILNIYILMTEATMTYARIFQSGNSQAVRLPKEFRFNTDKVEIFRRGNEIVLREQTSNALAVFDALSNLPSDFMAQGREDTPPQDRERF